MPKLLSFLVIIIPAVGLVLLELLVVVAVLLLLLPQLVLVLLLRWCISSSICRSCIH